MAFKIKKSVPVKASPETESAEGDAPVEGEILSPAAQMANLPGVESVDRVFVASENAFDFLQRNKVAILGAVGAVVLGLIAFGGVKSLAAQRAYDDSLVVYRAAAQTYAPIGSEADAGDFWAQGDSIFADQAARNSARVSESLNAIENTKGGAKRLARLLQAGALVDAGKGADAQAHYDAFRAGAVNNLERLVADFSSASVSAAAGDLQGALAKLDALATAEPKLKDAVMEQRASLIDTYGSREEAKAAWSAIAEAQKDTPFGQRAASRVAQLEILTASVAQ